MKIKAARLVWDSEIYPRTTIDNTQISRMVESLKQGNELPQIIVEKKTFRIVDGVHRWKAHQKMRGDDCSVECEIRAYESDADLLLDAMRLNSQHGLNITSLDRLRCFYIGEKAGLTREKIAEALRIRYDKAERTLTKRTAYREGHEPVALKTSMMSLAGKNLDETEESVNDMAGGMHPLYYVNHMIGLLEAGIHERSNEQFMMRLKTLYEMLEGIFAVVPGK